MAFDKAAFLSTLAVTPTDRPPPTNIMSLITETCIAATVLLLKGKYKVTGDESG
jgi:hypothetical protein